MIKNFLLLLIVICLLSSCNNRRGRLSLGEPTPIPLNFKAITNSIHDIGLIKDVEIIHLQSNDYVIGTINIIIRFGDKLYLMDNTQNQSVYVFTVEGEFVQAITNHGRGPEEYKYELILCRDNSRY